MNALPDDERLFCTCGIELGLVRLNADTVVLAHRVNPKNRRHYPRPASRSGQDTRRVPVALAPARIGAPHGDALVSRGGGKRSTGPDREVPPGLHPAPSGAVDVWTPSSRTPAPLSAGRRSVARGG